MGVTITKRGQPPRFNGDGVARLIKGLVPGMILERTNKGIDINGQQFAAYSRRYRNRLRLMGEDPKVDLRLSGGLLNSVKARGATLRADSVEVTIAPDTGTSPVWAPKAGGKQRQERAMRKFARAGKKGNYALIPIAARQEATAYRSRRTGKQSPPHNVVGYWLHHGTPTMKARPFMGLTDEQWRTLRAAIAKVMWK